MGRVRRWLSRPLLLGALMAAALVAGAGLYWFEPWKLVRDETVREGIPTAAAVDESAESPSGAPAANASKPPRAPETLATGEFISHEHRTSGKVRILQLPDGSRTLRLTGLDTSNGPDLRVWITDAPVKEGTAGWGVFDDGKYESLGRLKGNKGDQNYALPAALDLDRYGSVSIWCDRFNVSFGAAELTRA
ncbi:DM13 domain-containing protein [Streptomyces sp. H27-C3]|uniref:DM13 domain-containing protein n=1 Tax=Streptomyces sp. H27-C3 TaxID=3046305 RepID=UPI0024B9FAFF|nr:DM13 domain-containing protein [Streptomyces sp. H27-C3]MDJ0463531.1 DM13 domain-containing protein [Streptomyces sp. H27-C3]